MSSSETVKAIATASGYSQSAVGAAAYTISSSALAKGTYEIQNLASGMVLDGGGPGTTKGTWVVQDASSSGSNQQWTVTSLGNNTYEIISVANDLSLDDYAGATANGTEVDVYTNSASQGNTGQIWYLTPASNGYYTLKSQDIVNAGVSSCIEPSGGSTASGAQIVIYNGCDTPTSAQQWGVCAGYSCPASSCEWDVRDSEPGQRHGSGWRRLGHNQGNLGGAGCQLRRQQSGLDGDR